MIDCTIETMAATGALTDDARRWEHVMSRAFGNPPVDEDGAQRWWRGLCADGARLRGAWPTGPEPGVARRTPYATFASFDGTSAGVRAATACSPPSCAPTSPRRPGGA